MDKRLLRPLLAAEFLVAITAVFTLWSQVGSQYHLDLIFWPWKLGIGMGAAALAVAITASLVHSEGEFTKRVLLQCSLLIVLAVVAGMVTYYYHVNEPQEQDEEQDTQQTSQLYDSLDSMHVNLAVPDELAAVPMPA